MKTADCYNCGSADHDFFAEENGFTMVRCRRCGLLYVRDRPSNDHIAEATRSGKHRGADKELDATGHFNKDAVRRYQVVLRDLFGGDIDQIRTWLDVGCGHGEFISTVQLVSGAQIAIKGSEPNVKKQESARSRGLNVTYIDLETHHDQYDMISLLDVYSHLPNPVEFLALLKKRLHPGGQILLETGDCAKFSADEITRPLCLPDHLSFASERIIVGILERLGFRLVKIKKYPYLYRDARTIAKEVMKLVLPGYKSYLKYYLNWQKHAETNMYIRAKLTE